MKSFKAKLTILLIAMLVVTMLVPFGSVAAAEGDLQVQLIGTDDDNDGTVDNIVVYVEGLENEAFDYALAGENATEGDKTWIKSVSDNSSTEANQVAVIAAGDLTEDNNYLYIRENDGTERNVQLNISNIFTKNDMYLVETTTKRVLTEEAKDLDSRVETVDGITYTYTVGGLKITDDQNAEYSYVMVKLPAEGYSQLQELADELNSNYESKTMYSKIEFANEFYNQYNTLIENADNDNSWQAVENMQILQPEDYGQQEHYVVLLKKVSEDGTTTYDAKFMRTYYEGIEEVEPARLEQVSHQETSKLPITGDSIVLFVVLAALVIIAIVVFIRMKKLNKKADK